MSLGKRQEVKKAGAVVGYLEYVALGSLWCPVTFGVAPSATDVWLEGSGAGVCEEGWEDDGC